MADTAQNVLYTLARHFKCITLTFHHLTLLSFNILCALERSDFHEKHFKASPETRLCTALVIIQLIQNVIKQSNTICK